MPAKQDAGLGLKCAFAAFKTVLIITGIPKFIICLIAFMAGIVALGVGVLGMSEQIAHQIQGISNDGIRTLVGLAKKLILTLLVGLLIGGLYGMVMIILGLRGSCTRNLNYLGLYIHFSIVYLIAMGTVFTVLTRIYKLHPPARRYTSYDSESPYSSYESNYFVNHETQRNNSDDYYEGNNSVNNNESSSTEGGLFATMNIDQYLAEKMYQNKGENMAYYSLLTHLICACIDVFVLPPYIYLLYRWKQKEESGEESL